MKYAGIIAAIAAVCLAQGSPTFEAASIKPADIEPGGGYTSWSKGGPGTDDPTRIDYHNTSLSDLICQAYSIEHYQVVGPDWLATERYQLAATLSKGTTKDQFRIMIRNLLIERFKLKVHPDQKEMERYSLTVAKSGSKLKPHIATPTPDAPQEFGSKVDTDGYPLIPSAGMAMRNGRARMKFPDWDVDKLTAILSGQLRAPVHNDTGLAGKYDFDLFWSTRRSDVGEDGPDLIMAVQEQLGLRLERKKGSVDVFVIDHVERIPTAN